MIFTLAACSLARLGYSNGDTITYWWLNGYVGFDTYQRPWVRERIDKLFAWHRQSQLKEYIRLLTVAQSRLQHEITKEQVLADYDELSKCGDRMVEKAAPDLADLAISMTPDNMEHLRQKFDSNNEKFREDYLRGSVQGRQEHRYKAIMEWAEYWFGDFSEAQEAVIRKMSDQRPLNNEMWAADRIQRQQSLIALVKRIQLEKPPRDVVTGMIKTFITNNYFSRTSATPEMKAFYDASKDGVAELTVTIVNITTPEQKAHATAKLQQWIDDFNALANKS